MFKKFYPTIYRDSVYTTDFEEYKKQGYKALFFDIDNTLVGHDAPANEAAINLISHLKETGFAICILSNNHEPRVKSFSDAVGAQYVFEAHKPSGEGYEKAMQITGSDKTDSLAIGDQLFTDIWGANRAGIKSILVKPLGPELLLKVKLKRIGEKIVLPFYRRYARKHPETI
ncbi:MAG: YqeG family HAD IIIA-type phosphatase [Lachnospiraceae bacterium]|nr:YqeG family HAD IIIA-type phosphatase [Lachnospiraceae bacterium]